MIAWYLYAVNGIAFAMYGIDKWKAIHGRWRIPEAELLTIAMIGGAAGAMLAMLLFRHKTQKPRFRYGIPFLLLAEILIGFYLRV